MVGHTPDSPALSEVADEEGYSTEQEEGRVAEVSKRVYNLLLGKHRVVIHTSSSSGEMFYHIRLQRKIKGFWRAVDRTGLMPKSLRPDATFTEVVFQGIEKMQKDNDAHYTRILTASEQRKLASRTLKNLPEDRSE